MKTSTRTGTGTKTRPNGRRSKLWKAAVTASSSEARDAAVGVVKAHTIKRHAVDPSPDDIDRKIAAEARGIIDYVLATPPGAILVTVRNRWVVLRGVVDDWNEQETVGRVVGHLEGVRGVTNSIQVEAKGSSCWPNVCARVANPFVAED